MINTLGQRLKYLRTQQRLSISELKDRLKIKISITTISNLENDKQDINTETLMALSDFYNVSLDYLLRGMEFEEYKQEKAMNDMYGYSEDIPPFDDVPIPEEPPLSEYEPQEPPLSLEEVLYEPKENLYKELSNYEKQVLSHMLDRLKGNLEKTNQK